MKKKAIVAGVVVLSLLSLVWQTLKFVVAVMLYNRLSVPDSSVLLSGLILIYASMRISASFRRHDDRGRERREVKRFAELRDALGKALGQTIQCSEDDDLRAEKPEYKYHDLVSHVWSVVGSGALVLLAAFHLIFG